MNPTSQLTQIGKYKILSELGRGGMGVVYRAEDKFIGREVAIKTLADTTPEMRQRFAIEARSGVLNHPNIVTIYDFGEHEGNPYIVMEFLRGLTLDRIVKENHPLALVDKLDIIRQVCEGLGYAHLRGVVHRDIKPANVVLLQNGGVKLVDFGIAQLESLSGHTVAGSVIGTYQYLSPERLKGEISDGRGDIWSAGVLLYLLLTGTLPFPGEDISALHRVITDPYPPLGSLLSTAYPESLDHIVARALAKNPAERYATALEMSGDLEDARDALRLSRVEDLLGQARSLIDGDELLRARPLLLDLQRLAPQNTAVRNLLRELQTRLGQGSDPRAGAFGVPGKHEALASEINGAARSPMLGAVAGAVQASPAPVSPAPSPAPVVSAEEERRHRIIEQIVVEIRAQAQRGNGVRALELVGRSLERAPGNAALLALQEELRDTLEPSELSTQTAPELQSRPAVPAVLPEPITAKPAASPRAAEVAVLSVPRPGPEPPSELLSQAASAPAQAEASQPKPTPEVARAADPAPGPSPKPVALPVRVPAAVAAAEAISTVPAPPATIPELPPKITAPEILPLPAALASPSSPAAPSAAPQVPSAAASSATSPEAAGVNATSGQPQPAPAEIAAVDRPVLRPETRQDSEASQPAPARSARRSGILLLTAVVAGLLLAVLLLVVRHHHRAAALPATYAQLVASPYARVLRLTASNGENVPLPAGDHLTPLRVDGLHPGTYTLELQGADGGMTEAHCSLDAQGHLCPATVAPLSDGDLRAILNGGTHP